MADGATTNGSDCFSSYIGHMEAGAPETTELQGERRLAQRLHTFSNMVQAFYFGRTERPLGLASAEWRVLRATILKPRISQAEVAMGEGINVMSVSRAVAGLRRKALIEVEVDPDDRRKTMLSPTALGQELGADIGLREQIVYEHVFSVLSDAEKGLLDELLGRVNEHVRREELPPTPPPSRDWTAALNAAFAD